MKTDWSKRAYNSSMEMAKCTAKIGEESFKPVPYVAKNGARLRRVDTRWKARQYPFGVSPQIALAVKFDLNPWTLKRWTT